MGFYCLFLSLCLMYQQFSGTLHTTYPSTLWSPTADFIPDTWKAESWHKDLVNTEVLPLS